MIHYYVILWPCRQHDWTFKIPKALNLYRIRTKIGVRTFLQISCSGLRDQCDSGSTIKKKANNCHKFESFPRIGLDWIILKLAHIQFCPKLTWISCPSTALTIKRLRLYLSTIPTYNSHFNSRLNFHFLLSRSGNSSKKNSHFYLIRSGNLSGN